MKKFGLIAGGIVLAVVLLLFIGRQVAIGYLTPDFLVQQIESRWKCRAHIESVDVRILGTATIELKGVAIGKRDTHARKQTLLADRPPLENAELSSDSVLLEVRPMPLIKRQLDIRRLALQGAYVDTSIRKSGKLSIERLFEEPGSGGGGKQGKGKGADASEGAIIGAEIGAHAGEIAGAVIGDNNAPEGELSAGEEVIVTEEEDEEKFNVESIPVAMVADRIEINDGSADVVIDASGARVTLKNIQLGFSEIDVDPANLDARNRTAFQLGGDLVVQPREGETEYVRTHLSGVGTMRPFDPVSGEFNPAISSALTIHQGTKLDTFPAVAKVQELLEEVDAAGIEFGDFTLRGELTADAHTRVAYEQPKIILEEPLTIELPDTAVTMNAESWMDTGTNGHRMEGVLTASEELTAKIDGMVDAFLKEKAGAFASEGLRDTILSPLKVDGRVAVEVISQGDLGDPEADIVTPLGNLTEVIDTGKMLKDTLQEAGKSFLKGLLGGDKEKP